MDQSLSDSLLKEKLMVLGILFFKMAHIFMDKCRIILLRVMKVPSFLKNLNTKASLDLIILKVTVNNRDKIINFKESIHAEGKLKGSYNGYNNK